MSEMQYLNILRELTALSAQGAKPRETRAKLASTGQPVKAYSVFGRMLRFDLSKSFPLMTTKRMPFSHICHEMIWMLSGSSNIRYLNANGVRIWDEWADQDGDLGSVYGAQMRGTYPPDILNSKPVDQIAVLMHGLRTNPYSRRHLVNLWNVEELSAMALPPCVFAYNFRLSTDKDGVERLSCAVHQRSADAFLGLPWNIAAYALLTCMIASSLGKEPGELVWHGDDVHLYQNLVEPALRQLDRSPMPPPTLEIKVKKEMPWEYTLADLSLVGYNSHPGIKGEVAV